MRGVFDTRAYAHAMLMSYKYDFVSKMIDLKKISHYKTSSKYQNLLA